tara:strand:- start:9 stop:524 length:516 start_codon:yes stop_codon:yes gene_type:complete
MSKQEYWDNLLVSKYGFYKPKMGLLVYHFFREYNPDGLADGRVTKEGVEWFDSLELKRCRDRSDAETVRFISWSLPLDTFIGVHSLSLQAALEQCLSGKQQKADVFKAIRLYKWVRLNLTGTQARKNKKKTERKQEFKRDWEKNNEGEKYGPRLKINFRENDKRTNWSTVK